MDDGQRKTKRRGRKHENPTKLTYWPLAVSVVVFVSLPKCKRQRSFLGDLKPKITTWESILIGYRFF